MAQPLRRDTDAGLPAGLLLVPARRILAYSPTVRVALDPADRVLVEPGQTVVAGSAIAERTPDAAVVDVGHLENGVAHEEEASLTGSMAHERRSPAVPGKWWVGGEQRRGRLGRHYLTRRLAGPLLFQHGGRWRAAAGERHETVEAPADGIVRSAVTGVEVTIEVSGVGLIGAVAAGSIARGYLDVQATAETDLHISNLDVGRSGAIVVGGSRIDAEALTRARAMGVRGLVASSISSADLRDMAASEARQRASLHSLAPFAALGLDGYVRRPIPSPVLALLRALNRHDVAVSIDPPMLLFEPKDVDLPEVAPDWVRVRSGPLAGREGRWIRSSGIRRFRSGAHLHAAAVRFADDELVVPANDLERFDI